MARQAAARPSRTTHERGTRAGGGRSGARISEIQRARLLKAMAEVAYERGASGVSVALVTEQAGVSRRTFYELFRDREDCLVQALQTAIERVRRRIAETHDPCAEWAQAIRTALRAVLRLFEEEPATGKLAVVEALAAGPRALELHRETVAQIVATVDARRGQVEVSSPGVLVLAEGVVGGAISLVHDRMLADGAGALTSLLNPLTSMILLPYLGREVARRELERPMGPEERRARVAHGNPLKGLDMRLTYRTARVLSTIATHPGSSNRAIGDTSGIEDQGQISRLLARLERVGLVENAHVGEARGAGNAWALTAQGKEVANALAS